MYFAIYAPYNRRCHLQLQSWPAEPADRHWRVNPQAKSESQGQHTRVSRRKVAWHARILSRLFARGSSGAAPAMLCSQSRLLGQANSCCSAPRALAPSRLPRSASQPGSLFGTAAAAALAVSPAQPAMAHHAPDSLRSSASTPAKRRASVVTPATAVAHAPPAAAQPAAAATRRGRPPKKSSSSSPASTASGSPSQTLRQVPCVGPKNEALFREKGVHTVQQLQLVHAQNGGNPEATKAFLQDVVGIKNKGHISQIVAYLCQPSALAAAASGLQDAAQQGQQPGSFMADLDSIVQQAAKVTLSVEGNISAGKSTFLRMLRESIRDEDMRVVPEPVDKWQNVGNGKVNLLMEFYQNPQRFAYTFQNYVFLTRMVQERDSYSQSMCRLLERSVFSDRMVFVRAVHKSKFMNDTELAIYDSWFDPVLATLPTLVPNGFIYLRANPETCYRRMQKRSRSEESTVQLEYLQDLHSHHEDWLWSGGVKATDSKYLHIPHSNQILLNNKPSGVNAASAPPPAGAASLQLLQPQQAPSSYEVPPVPAALRDSLYILDAKKGQHMLHHLDQVPALVLDCDTDVDVERDHEYRAHVAHQVQQYTAYVRDMMKAKANAHAAARKDAPFDGYFLRDSIGNIDYMGPQFHTLAHTDAPHMVQRAAAATAGRH